jgi:hypothetical protein
VTYRLHFDPASHATYRSLPDDARADLALCLIDTLADPLAHSAPYGVDDGVFRTIGRGRVAAVILIGDETITVVQITYIG